MNSHTIFCFRLAEAIIQMWRKQGEKEMKAQIMNIHLYFLHLFSLSKRNIYIFYYFNLVTEMNKHEYTINWIKFMKT